jgi:hypothetical protein
MFFEKFLCAKYFILSQDSFSSTNNYCLLLKKLTRSCNGDRRQVIDAKYPKLCPAVLDISDFINGVNCEQFENSKEAERVSAEHFVMIFKQ